MQISSIGHKLLYEINPCSPQLKLKVLPFNLTVKCRFLVSPWCLSQKKNIWLDLIFAKILFALLSYKKIICQSVYKQCNHNMLNCDHIPKQKIFIQVGFTPGANVIKIKTVITDFFSA
jgi:hypothetical protein